MSYETSIPLPIGLPQTSVHPKAMRYLSEVTFNRSDIAERLRQQNVPDEAMPSLTIELTDHLAAPVLYKNETRTLSVPLLRHRHVLRHAHLHSRTEEDALQIADMRMSRVLSWMLDHKLQAFADDIHGRTPEIQQSRRATVKKHVTRMAGHFVLCLGTAIGASYSTLLAYNQGLISESTGTLIDFLVTAASMGYVGLKTLQTTHKVIDAVQAPPEYEPDYKDPSVVVPDLVRVRFASVDDASPWDK